MEQGPLEAMAQHVAHAVLRAARTGDRLAIAGGTILWRWQVRARERRQLASLSERMLRDIGLTRADIEGECRKPFWMR